MIQQAVFVLASVLFTAAGQASQPQSTAILYADRTILVGSTLSDPSGGGDLWVTTADLKRINGFELKPEGACLDALCIPVERKGPKSIVLRKEGIDWFNVTGFARKIGQTFVSDPETRVWSFGEIPVLREGFVKSGIAPDFSLPDRRGKQVRLSDFRGKKILLLTWASW